MYEANSVESALVRSSDDSPAESDESIANAQSKEKHQGETTKAKRVNAKTRNSSPQTQPDELPLSSK